MKNALHKLIAHHENFIKTSTYIFNVFDYDKNDEVSISEVKEIIKALDLDKN
jgi:hypothetical protein